MSQEHESQSKRMMLGGPPIKLSIFFALNIIFRVGSCTYMLYDLTCQVWLNISTHNQSYGVNCCSSVFLTNDWLVTYSPLHITTPEWCQILYPMMESCLCIVYNLTYQIWLENSIHITSYGEILLQFCDLSSDSLVLGHLWSQHDVITSWLRLTANSNCFPNPS